MPTIKRPTGDRDVCALGFLDTERERCRSACGRIRIASTKRRCASTCVFVRRFDSKDASLSRLGRGGAKREEKRERSMRRVSKRTGMERKEREREADVRLLSQRCTCDLLFLDVLEKDPTRVVGSGYIQFPPQKPFQTPLQSQPPTLSQYEFPEAYGDGMKQALPLRSNVHVTKNQSVPLPSGRALPVAERHVRHATMRKDHVSNGTRRSTTGTSRATKDVRGQSSLVQAGTYEEGKMATRGYKATPTTSNPSMVEVQIKETSSNGAKEIMEGSEASTGVGRTTKMSKSQAKRLRKKMRDSQGVAGNL